MQNQLWQGHAYRPMCKSKENTNQDKETTDRYRTYASTENPPNPPQSKPEACQTQPLDGAEPTTS